MDGCIQKAPLHDFRKWIVFVFLIAKVVLFYKIESKTGKVACLTAIILLK